jgi:hypothetical protein
MGAWSIAWKMMMTIIATMTQWKRSGIFSSAGDAPAPTSSNTGPRHAECFREVKRIIRQRSPIAASRYQWLPNLSLRDRKQAASAFRLVAAVLTGT